MHVRWWYWRWLQHGVSQHRLAAKVLDRVDDGGDRVGTFPDAYHLALDDRGAQSQLLFAQLRAGFAADRDFVGAAAPRVHELDELGDIGESADVQFGGFRKGEYGPRGRGLGTRRKGEFVRRH